MEYRAKKLRAGEYLYRGFLCELVDGRWDFGHRWWAIVNRVTLEVLNYWPTLYECKWDIDEMYETGEYLEYMDQFGRDEIRAILGV